MGNKHYTIDYLENTGSFLKNLKEFSYKPFLSLNEGVIIDFGCGTGKDVMNLSMLINDKIKIVGIDHDTNLLPKSNTYNNHINIEFIVSEAYSTPFEDNSISGIRAERLLQHLKEPDKFMKEISRLLRNDCPIVLVETDWVGLTFYTEYINIEEKIIKYLTQEKINNGLASRMLTKYLEDYCFKNLTVEIFPFVLHSLKEANEYLWIEKILKEVFENRFITEEEYSIFLKKLQQLDLDNYFSCSMNIVVVSAVK